MTAYEAWLAAMPVEDVDERIAELERELQVLRLLKRRRAAAVHGEHVAEQAKPVLPLPRRKRRLSPEREAIVMLIAKNPEGVSPADVSRALEVSPNAAQTNLSRMQEAGMVQRVAQGLYRLPAHIPASEILNGVTLPFGAGEEDDGGGSP
jgi:hypothetical protein